MNFFKKYSWLIVPILCFAGIRFLLDFDGLYGQDSYEYYRFTKAVHHFIATGEYPGAFFWPVNYPLVGAFFSFVLPTAWALQLVSFGAFILTLILLKKLLDAEFPEQKNAGLYLLITAVLSPYFFRASLLEMSDMLATLFVLLAIYLWKAYQPTLKKQYAFLFALTAALAFLTRYVALLVLIPFGFQLLVLFWKEKQAKTFLISVVIFVLACLPQFILQTDSVQEYTNQLVILDWNIVHFFQSQFVTHNGQLNHPYINLMYVFAPVFHPGYLASGIGLVFFLFRYRSKPATPSLFMRLLLVSTVLYLFFLGGIPTQNMRFFIPIFPLVVLLLYKGYLLAQEKLPKPFFLILYLGAALGQITYFSISFSKLYARHHLEKSMATFIKDIPGEQPVYSFAVEGMLQTRGIERPVKSLYYEQYNQFETDALVVFNLEQFQDQWKGQNPMLNWNQMQKTHSVQELKDFGQGWKIYRIE